MPPHFGIPFLTACTVMLVLACLCAGCASSQSPPQPASATPSPSGSANAITIKNFAFSPATLTIKTGATVTWTNDDSAPHTVVSDAGSPVPFTSPQLATGASYPQTFTRAGTYGYHCSIHPSMKGTIVVEP
ncbi:MAG: cupredoxin family copper-binding protein [Methanoregula sp.]